MFVSYDKSKDAPYFSMEALGEVVICTLSNLLPSQCMEIDLADVIYYVDVVYPGIWTGTPEALISINELQEIGEQLYKELYDL